MPRSAIILLCLVGGAACISAQTLNDTVAAPGNDTGEVVSWCLAAVSVPCILPLQRLTLLPTRHLHQAFASPPAPEREAALAADANLACAAPCYIVTSRYPFKQCGPSCDPAVCNRGARAACLQVQCTPCILAGAQLTHLLLGPAPPFQVLTRSRPRTCAARSPSQTVAAQSALTR